MTDEATATARIPFGRAPIPADRDEVVARLRRWLDDEIGAEGFVDEQGRRREPELGALLSGTELREVTVDLTRIAVPFALPTGLVEPEPFDPATGHPLPRVETEAEPVVRRTPAKLGELRLIGRPVEFAGAPLVVDAVVRDLRFDWVETRDGALWIEEVPLPDAEPLHGFVQVSARTADLAAMLRQLVETALAEAGARVRNLELDVQGSTRDELRFTAFGRIGMGPFSGSARLVGAASVDRRFTMRFRRLRLTSGNPVIAIALLFARRAVREARRTKISLTEQLPPGTRLAEFSIDAGTGERIELVTRFR